MIMIIVIIIIIIITLMIQIMTSTLDSKLDFSWQRQKNRTDHVLMTNSLQLSFSGERFHDNCSKIKFLKRSAFLSCCCFDHYLFTVVLCPCRPHPSPACGWQSWKKKRRGVVAGDCAVGWRWNRRSTRGAGTWIHRSSLILLCCSGNHSLHMYCHKIYRHLGFPCSGKKPRPWHPRVTFPLLEKLFIVTGWIRLCCIWQWLYFSVSVAESMLASQNIDSN